MGFLSLLESLMSDDFNKIVGHKNELSLRVTGGSRT
jgi:hypothetical protein